MKLRTMVLGAATAAFLAVPTMALAAWGQVTGNVNFRSGPTTAAPSYGTLAAGTRLWVNGPAGGGWLSVRVGKTNGYVSGNYVATSYANNVQPRYMQPRFNNRPPAPLFGYKQKPWWDNQKQAWYDGRRWYHNGIWYRDPSGFSMGFSFGG